jgi:hypothetical protein
MARGQGGGLLGGDGAGGRGKEHEAEPVDAGRDHAVEHPRVGDAANLDLGHVLIPERILIPVTS